MVDIELGLPPATSSSVRRHQADPRCGVAGVEASRADAQRRRERGKQQQPMGGGPMRTYRFPLSRYKQRKLNIVIFGSGVYE